MNIFCNKISIIVIVAVLFLAYAMNISAATTPVEVKEACLKFVDNRWFTAGNLQVNTGWCQWVGDSFGVNDGIVRAYMSIIFGDGLTPEYRKKNLGSEIIGNPNTYNGALQVGDEKGDSDSWTKLLEFPIGDYGITFQDGSSIGTPVGGIDFHFIVGVCTVKVSGSELVDRLKGPKKMYYFDYLRQITTEKAQEIAEKLKNEPLCTVGSKPSETLPAPPVENLPEVEALVEKTPTNGDLPTPSKTEQAPENWGEAIVIRMTGGADMQLADGSWQTIEVGTKIPLGAKLFSSYASEVTLEFPDHNLVIIVLALSEFDIDNPVDYIKNTPLLKIGSGDVRFKVNQSDFRTDMNVSTPNSTASPTGTDFGVSYDKKTGRTVWEIYDHSIAVTSNNTGETKTISSSYGAPIKRIEVSKDGVMTEQVAIPKDEWRARKAETASQTQPQENSGSGLFWIFIFLVFGGGVFILQKTGKLQPIFQKVLKLVRRNDPIQS